MTDAQKEQLYTDFHDKVYGYIISKINNAFNADDLTSDVFMKVYEKIDSFDETKSSLSTWIYTITRNTLTDYYRTRKVSEEVPETMADGSSVEDEICNAEELSNLAKALKKLDERERDIIVARYYSGRTLKEIAEEMGISYAYVKILQTKALGTLRKYLSD